MCVLKKTFFKTLFPSGFFLTGEGFIFFQYGVLSRTLEYNEWTREQIVSKYAPIIVDCWDLLRELGIAHTHTHYLIRFASQIKLQPHPHIIVYA